MQIRSLRWAFGLGALAAVVGLVAQLISGWFQPSTNPATVDQEVQYFVVGGTLLLVSMAITLGLAYYAGIRTEWERGAQAPASPSGYGIEGREAAWAGAIVGVAYWLATTLVLVLAPHRTGDLLTGRIILLVVLVVFGYLLGAQGGRAPAARNLLNEIASAPRSSIAPLAGHTAPAQADEAGAPASEPNTRGDNEV